MALISMTGFGRAEGALGDIAWAWEARSVNGKGLDVRVRTPPGLDQMDARAREEAAARFKRGSIQLTLQLKREAAAAPPLRVNTDVVERLLAESAPYLATGRVAAPDWALLLQVRGVIEYADPETDEAARAARDAALGAGLAAALDALAAGRRKEGEALFAILSGTLDTIAALAAQARAIAADQPAALKVRFEERLRDLLAAAPVDEGRIVQEAAALALKADVREELDRLDAHVAQARALIANGDGAGRKLEFLAQEFLRETNTVCSKAAVLPLTRIGLALKSAVDQLKEQAANVE